MKKETRKALRSAILEQINDDMLPLTVGGHVITDRIVYAGCSQWSGCGRDWDSSRSGFAWVVDGEYQLTFPKLDYFDGHNQIERQSKYYLQPDRSEDPPDAPIGEPLVNVPDEILLDIATGLAAAITAHKKKQSAQDQDAIGLIARLEVRAAEEAK